ncbi:hypothetical protein SLE2022_012660 [Rubroshorea leprosula]
MDNTQHNFITVQGLKLHLAELGSGPNVVLFLHGFPEIWYSWRHQTVAVANAGFRAVAPDYKGYGLSDPPPEPEKATFADLISDVVAIIDHLGVFVIGKDTGGLVANFFAVLHPDRVSGVVTFGVPFIPPPFQFHEQLPEGFYVGRFMQPGRAEVDFRPFDAKTVVKNIYILFSRSEIPIAAENQEVMDLVDPSTPPPAWFTEEDLAVYGALYEKSGFQTAMKVPYKAMHEEEFGLTDPKLEAPALLIMGCKDYILKFPGMEDYIKSGKVKEVVPKLDTVFLSEGSHFVQEQLPELVNELILGFLKVHS